MQFGHSDLKGFALERFSNGTKIAMWVLDWELKALEILDLIKNHRFTTFLFNPGGLSRGLNFRSTSYNAVSARSVQLSSSKV